MLSEAGFVASESNLRSSSEDHLKPNGGGGKLPSRVRCRKVSWVRVRSYRGVAQPGRALRSGRRGRRFKSYHPDSFTSPLGPSVGGLVSFRRSGAALRAPRLLAPPSASLAGLGFDSGLRPSLQIPITSVSSPPARPMVGGLVSFRRSGAALRAPRLLASPSASLAGLGFDSGLRPSLQIPITSTKRQTPMSDKFVGVRITDRLALLSFREHVRKQDRGRRPQHHRGHRRPDRDRYRRRPEGHANGDHDPPRRRCSCSSLRSALPRAACPPLGGVPRSNTACRSAIRAVDVGKPDIECAHRVLQPSGSRSDAGHDVVVLSLAGLDASVEEPDFHEESLFGV